MSEKQTCYVATDGKQTLEREMRDSLGGYYSASKTLAHRLMREYYPNTPYKVVRITAEYVDADDAPQHEHLKEHLKEQPIE